MRKMSIKEKKDRSYLNKKLCIFFILLLVLFVTISISIYLNIDEVILVETSNIQNNFLQEEATSNLKVEVLDYEKLDYYIKVNCKAQTVTIYTCNENGEYVIPIKAMLCSTGVATPNTGVYPICNKYEWRSLVGNVYGQYSTRITGSILFHSVPYTKQDKSTLEYWEYDKLGQPASKGCVRLTVEDAKWIYDYCKIGTKVEFYEDDNPGPLGKPVEMKISDYDDELKRWDPTDLDENNPWIKLYENEN